MVLYQMGEHLIALDKHNLSHHQIVIWIALILHMSNSTKIITNTETTMLSRLHFSERTWEYHERVAARGEMPRPLSFRLDKDGGQVLGDLDEAAER